MTPPLTFIVSEDKLTSVQKASMKNPNKEDFYGRPYSTGMDSYDMDSFNLATKKYNDHLASLLTAHNSPSLQAIIRPGQELKVGEDCELRYEIAILYNDNSEWMEVKKETYDSIPVKDNRRIILTHIEVAEQGEDGRDKLFKLLSEYGGTIESTGSMDEMNIKQAQASNRMWVDENGLGFVWMPTSAIPVTVEQVKLFEQWFPLDVPLPDSLKTLKQPTSPAQTILDAAKEYADTGWKYIEDEDGKDKTVIDEKIYNAFIAGASMNVRGGDAIAFAEWIRIEGYEWKEDEKKYGSKRLRRIAVNDWIFYTIQELYSLFLQQSPAARERVFTLQQLKDAYDAGEQAVILHKRLLHRIGMKETYFKTKFNETL